MSDHSHPPTLEERAEEAAEGAVCQRCGVIILRDSSREGVVFARVMVPILRVNEAFQLCGRCGLELREFLNPSVLQDENYLRNKQQLLAEFWT